MKKYQINQINILQEKINRMDPIDIAEQFDNLTAYEITLRIKLLSKDLLADTFAELSKEKKMEIIEILSDEDTSELIKELDENELVDTLQELPANMVKKIMQYFVTEDRRPIINQLLGYPEESVGSVMTVNFLAAKDRLSLKEIYNLVLQSDLDANKLEQIWITDSSLRLLGFIHLGDLIRYPQAKVSELLKGLTRTVLATDDQEVVAKLAQKYDLSEIPVVDSENRLVGTVPVEWAIDILAEEYHEDFGNIHGINDSEETQYLKQSDLVIARSRITWLIICLITASVTGFIIQRYEVTLATNVALAMYIPMLMDSGGNAGSQSSTTIIRALYLGELQGISFVKILLKELRIGFIVGLALVAVNMVRILILDSVSFQVNLVVSITLLMTVMLSKVIGGLLPILADKLKIDPTVMAGPLITTIVDTASLLVYFEVASRLLNI
ncbi:magnesium transporter [Facklamia sp. 7083-14-GEN3]|uniref:magnesium transporter n=1 Tax=Facklamia sp. 7083-14-GEN3 TaxID=2973478 RepID=UPI00215B86C8|nr:magnesium transporter [Facklamia sp. 7083-14-GEN3]MCR8968413.1 magnesium transporter [Facklamia sp. 7083-14-GEN3]